MKTIVIVAGIVLAGAAVIAVVQSDKKEGSSPAVHQHQEGESHTADSTGSPLINPEHGQPGHRCDLPVGAPLSGEAPGSVNAPNLPATNSGQLPVQQKNTGSLKTNPAHGMPGHKCELPVGAPLP